MKIGANAGTLTRALALAASLDAGKHTHAAPDAVNVIAGEGAAVTVVRSVLENQICLTIPAAIERAGSMAMPITRLAGLAAGFPATADIVIEADGAAAKVRSGRSRYTLPTIPAKDLPLALTVAADAAGIALIRADALALFAAGFAAADDARTYICGLHIADSAAGLIAVATNGYALARRVLPGVAGLGSGITVPTAAIKAINKLLADKGVEYVRLLHAQALLSVATPAGVFTTKLIAGSFPDDARIVPKPSGNVATMRRDILVMALTRLAAVGARTVRLSWTASEPALHLTSRDMEDLIDAETAGTGMVTLAIDRLSALLDEFAGKTTTIDATNPTTPVRITAGGDAGFLCVLAPTAGAPA